MDPTYTFQTFDDRVDHVTPRFNNLLGINNFDLIAGFYGSGAAGGSQLGLFADAERHVHPRELSGVTADAPQSCVRQDRPGSIIRHPEWRRGPFGDYPGIEKLADE